MEEPGNVTAGSVWLILGIVLLIIALWQFYLYFKKDSQLIVIISMTVISLGCLSIGIAILTNQDITARTMWFGILAAIYVVSYFLIGSIGAERRRKTT